MKDADAVRRFRARRAKRVQARFDAGLGWLFSALSGYGVDTTGMKVPEAFAKLAEIRGNVKEGKESEKTPHKVAEGKDISKTWHRRPEEFDFEIEDVINAQGFDGLPRVVDKEEFDKAVKAANGGKGFIAQRSYSAPDKETLDAYREQLYGGKWYVDCSEGGAQYGQGMYCAADYSGEITQGMRDEMQHYQELGKDRLQTEAQRAFEKTFTKEEFEKEAKHEYTQEEFDLLKRARVVDDDDLTSEEKGRLIDMIDNGKYMEFLDAVNKKSEKFVADYMKGNGYFNVETMTLDPSARVISYADAGSEVAIQYAKRENNLSGREVNKLRSISRLRKEEFRDAMSRLKSENPRLYDAYQKARDWRWGELEDDGDLGVEVAKLGYDAINAEGHGESGSYTVILNRTKCIFLRGD